MLLHKQIDTYSSHLRNVSIVEKSTVFGDCSTKPQQTFHTDLGVTECAEICQCLAELTGADIGQSTK